MSRPLKLRRSFLYSAPMHEAGLKAGRTAPADLICYDLEDATPPPAKPGARQVIADHLAAGRPAAREVLVRVNALDTEWGHADLRFAAGLGIDGVLLPKVEGAATVRQARAVLDQAGGARIGIWCLVETPLGVLRAEEIAAAGVEGLVIGGVDLAEGLGARPGPSRLPVWHALSQVVLAARAFRIAAIDAVAFGDEAALEAACRQSADLGFDGRSLFDPATVETANRMFSPGEEDIAKAQAALAGGTGYGAHLAAARRVLDFAALARGGNDKQEG